MKQSQRLVKNAVFGVGGSVTGGLLYLATVVLIAHSVSVHEFGSYSFVLALAMFVSNLADSGLPKMLLREVSKDHEGFVAVAGATLSLIWVICGAMCIIVWLVVPFLRLDSDIKIATIIMSVATVADFRACAYSAILRAFEDYELERLGYVLHKLFVLGSVYVSIRLQLGLIGFVSAHLLANFLDWKYSQTLVERFYARIPLNFDVPLWKRLLVSSLPLGAGSMLRSLSMQLDILVLSWLTNLTTVGLFSGPYRISVALRTIPQTLSQPLYPLLARTAVVSPDRFGEVYRLSIRFFLLISIPMGTVFAAWSGPILLLALGDKYRPAIPAMQLLGIGLVPFFVSPLFQFVFAALDQQRRYLASICVTTGLRLVFLFALIPIFGFIGPALAFLFTETAIVIIWTAQLSRLGYPARLFSLVWRPLVAGGCMGIVLYLADSSSLILRSGMLAVGFIVYLLVLFILRTFSQEDLQHAREGIAFVTPFIESWSKKLRRTDG